MSPLVPYKIVNSTRLSDRGGDSADQPAVQQLAGPDDVDARSGAVGGGSAAGCGSRAT